MIRSLFAWLRKSKLEKWFTEKQVAVQEEYDQKHRDLVSQFNDRYDSIQKELQEKQELLERRERDVEDAFQRAEDRKKELLRVNDELKDQIRLIEAKASPDNIWASAFSQGFSKAWDMMMPLMNQGLNKVKEKIRQEEIELSFPRIDMIVDQRIKEIGNVSLMETSSIEQKKREFQLKMNQTQNQDEVKKLTNYITVLDWVLGNKNGN